MLVLPELNLPLRLRQLCCQAFHLFSETANLGLECLAGFLKDLNLQRQRHIRSLQDLNNWSCLGY